MLRGSTQSPIVWYGPISFRPCGVMPATSAGGIRHGHYFFSAIVETARSAATRTCKLEGNSRKCT